MNLIQKYNIAAPRYTSYPTVPYWEEDKFDLDKWKKCVKTTFTESNASEGISIYIHLPFCESLCTYCGCTTRITKNHKVEVPYLESLLKEWSLYLALFAEKPRIKEIHLGGGTPTFFSPAHLKRLLEGIYNTAEICEDAEFSFEGHPANTTEEHMQTLYELGFKRMSLGIQDFDPKVQDVINRYQSFEMVKEVVEKARKIGYNSINFDLVYGLPLQTRASVIHTINLVNKLRPDRISFYSYAHVPWIKPSQRKFTEADLPVDVEKRALYEIGKEKFRENGYVEIGMDHFALVSDDLYKAVKKQKLHRNFMGYSSSYTKLMVGLGASSIGDCWTAYGQNIKSVEEYKQAVEVGEFPVFRGHLLNKEDLKLRRHILNIMCRMETSWEKEEEQCEEIYKAIERLSEMEKDKLIGIEPYHLKVKPAGRPFLRNICMAFDARLWRKAPQSQVFSSVI